MVCSTFSIIGTTSVSIAENMASRSFSSDVERDIVSISTLSISRSSLFPSSSVVDGGVVDIFGRVSSNVVLDASTVK